MIQKYSEFQVYFYFVKQYLMLVDRVKKWTETKIIIIKKKCAMLYQTYFPTYYLYKLKTTNSSHWKASHDFHPSRPNIHETKLELTICSTCINSTAASAVIAFQHHLTTVYTPKQFATKLPFLLAFFQGWSRQ